MITAPSIENNEKLGVTVVPGHSIKVTQKKAIKALLNCKLNNDIFVGLEICTSFKGLRSITACANDVKFTLTHSLFLSFWSFGCVYI